MITHLLGLCVVELVHNHSVSIILSPHQVYAPTGNIVPAKELRSVLATQPHMSSGQYQWHDI
jgi:hypothetical protein